MTASVLKVSRSAVVLPTGFVAALRSFFPIPNASIVTRPARFGSRNTPAPEQPEETSQQSATAFPLNVHCLPDTLGAS